MTTTWQAKTPCRTDPDFWHPEGSSRSQTYRDDADLAAWVCRNRCYVRQQCLTSILRAEQGLPLSQRHGIAGGLAPAERAALATTTTPTRTAA
ncbi:WhiB family transcriptional regulator [Streptomyces axinellae]|uniref:4Fe-4S Wbl-type domain-containing protein n=1 Tax=Streptomyces axinellae TaxID=552788 RepID=A0ABP6CZJ6_9ACTN